MNWQVYVLCIVLYCTCRPYSVLAQTRGERSRPESTIAASKESMTESSTHTSDEELSMRCRLNKQFARDVESTYGGGRTPTNESNQSVQNVLA
jgi:hypothetical protein